MSEDDQHQTDPLRASLVDSGWSLPPEQAESAAPAGTKPAKPDASSALEALAAPRSGDARRPPPPPPPAARRNSGPPPLPPRNSPAPPRPPAGRSGPPPPPSTRAAHDESTNRAGVSSKPPRELPPYPEVARQSLAEVDDLLGRSDPHEALTTRVPADELLATMADGMPETKRGGAAHEEPTHVLPPSSTSEPRTIPQAAATPLPAFDLPAASATQNAPPTAPEPVTGADSGLPSFDFANPSAPAAGADLNATFPAAQSPLAAAAGAPQRTSDSIKPRGKSLPPAADALVGRVRESMADFSAKPVWVQRSVKAGVVLVVGAGLGYAAGRVTLGGIDNPAPAAASAAPVTANTEPAPSAAPVEPNAIPEPASEPEPASVVERARRGDADAISRLSAKLELTANEAIAVSEGERQQQVDRITELGEELAKDASLLHDSETLKTLIELARDDDTSRQTLAILAELPGPEAVDLIYEIWTGTRGRTDATSLAEALVYSKEVRPKASEALAVALDLRRAETCEERKALVERAVEFADRRSLHLLGKLNLRRGCGPTKREDCNPCLGDRKRLAEAIQHARREAAPRF